MKDRLEKLLEFAEEPEVYFAEYIKSRPKDGREKAIFVLEGKDDPKFYTAKFDAIIKREWKTLSVGGKSKVIELRDRIRKHPKFKEDSVYFFVDRDFDEKIPLMDVYTTPCYSVENLYCDPTTIKRLLEAECGLTKSEIKNRDEILDFLLEEYQALQAEFHRSNKIKLMNSVFLYVRRIKNNKKISLDKMFKIEVSLPNGNIKIKLKRGPAFLENRHTEKAHFREFVNTNGIWKEISEQPMRRFRGKQEILLLKAYLDSLKHDGYLSDITHKNFGIKIKTENPAMSNHVLSTVSQYVKTPDCLYKFLAAINDEHRERRVL